MRKPNIIKTVALGVTTLFAALIVSNSLAGAIAYNGDQTVSASGPAFNVFTGVPSVGDESDFFRARVPSGGNENETSTLYTDPLTVGACTNGQKVQMRVYVHNGAGADKNDNGNGPSVAHNTKVKVSLPAAAAASFTPSATISASNAATVNDNVSINCGGKVVKLKYLAGSAKQYAKGTNFVSLDDSIVTTGASIRSEQTPGDVWGCWDERVYVILTAVVEENVTPPPVAAKCELLSITASENRKVTINNFAVTQTNAALKSVVVDWGDNSSKLTVGSVDDVKGKTHQYSADGTYKISAVATFSVKDAADIVSGGPGTACAQEVTFTSNKPPVVTPPTTTTTTPSTLVNTGPGQVAGLFAAVSAAGTLGYRKMLGRKLARD